MLKYKLLSPVLYLAGFITFVVIAFLLVLTGLLYLPLFYKLDKLCCRVMMLSLCIWPKYSGKFPTEGTYIIMMNHSSFLDVFIFPLIPIGFYSGITAVENFKIPIFSMLIRRIQAIPIERKNRSAAIASIKRAEEVLAQNIHIGILPEGTRTLDGKLGEFKKGGFHMAINAKAPIVPVGVQGAFEFKPKDRWWMNPRKIEINIGNPTDPSAYETLGVDGLKSLIEKEIRELSGGEYAH
ncbi:MAG: lysophospholipid acyltransferase family protein [Candidatus Marinimicrobia bacterium]|nr:lysophospholipid acyltransferase family protein [Candidatus Neomarinimicrobiota bacterium]